MPLVLKKLDRRADASTRSHPQALLVLPLGALVAYGALRFSTTLFTELREFLFARVTQRAVRTIALQVFRHLHALSLRFHLNRQTGGMTRDIERGTRGVSSLVSYTLFSILPTLVEITLVLGYLAHALRHLVLDHHRGGAGHLHRLHHRRHRMAHAFPPHDERARFEGQHQAIDSLINYETVKYFGNEDYEAQALRRRPAELRDARRCARRPRCRC